MQNVLLWFYVTGCMIIILLICKELVLFTVYLLCFNCVHFRDNMHCCIKFTELLFYSSILSDFCDFIEFQQNLPISAWKHYACKQFSSWKSFFFFKFYDPKHEIASSLEINYGMCWNICSLFNVHWPNKAASLGLGLGAWLVTQQGPEKKLRLYGVFCNFENKVHNIILYYYYIRPVQKSWLLFLLTWHGHCH
jgi:hypothetical protein